MRNGLLAAGWKFLPVRPRESPFMVQVNAALTPTSWLSKVLRHLDDRSAKIPAAAEFPFSPPTMSAWVVRYVESGYTGLTERPSAQHESRTRTPAAVMGVLSDILPDGATDIAGSAPNVAQLWNGTSWVT